METNTTIEERVIPSFLFFFGGRTLRQVSPTPLRLGSRLARVSGDQTVKTIRKLCLIGWRPNPLASCPGSSCKANTEVLMLSGKMQHEHVTGHFHSSRVSDGADGLAHVGFLSGTALPTLGIKPYTPVFASCFGLLLSASSLFGRTVLEMPLLQEEDGRERFRPQVSGWHHGRWRRQTASFYFKRYGALFFS